MLSEDKRRRYILTGRRVCPYHKYSTQGAIYCKGFFDNSNLCITFGDVGDKNEYQKRYCCREWQKCKRATVLTNLIEKQEIFI